MPEPHPGVVGRAWSADFIAADDPHDGAPVLWTTVELDPDHGPVRQATLHLWDSMLPDSRINPGEMTSFNHYALGAVGEWMHRTIGGLAPLAPGYRRALIAPQPGGGLSWATADLETPYGTLACHWELDDGRLVVDVEVPDGITAVLRLPGRPEETLIAGAHRLICPATTFEGAS